METYYWNTEKYHADNSTTMSEYLDNINMERGTDADDPQIAVGAVRSNRRNFSPSFIMKNSGEFIYFRHFSIDFQNQRDIIEI